MGRKKKNDSERLVSLAREYFETDAGGDPAKLKCSNFERYAAEHGCEAKAYDFRRDKAVREFINGMRGRETKQEKTVPPAYRNLDIDELLRTSRTMEDFKRALREMDMYWKGVYNAAVSAEEEARALRRRAEAAGNTEALKKSLNILEGKVSRAEQDKKRLEGECRYLKRLLKAYLYPSVAEELLRQEKLPVPENLSVREDAFDALIEGKFPLNYEGRQGPPMEAASRQGRLLARMKEQVEHGK